ncbi:MAG: MFS transporter [Planctomycetota bacterium]
MNEAPDLRRAQRQAILLQCFTAVPMLAFSNGFMLTLFNQLGIEGEQALRLLGLPSLVSAFAIVLFAFWTDRIGVRTMGLIGISASLVAAVLLLIASWFKLSAFVCPIIILSGLGSAAFIACWFPLADPIVQPSGRGRFFGRLRMTWTLACIVVGFSIAALLRRPDPLDSCLIVLAGFVVIHALRIPLFRAIPDLSQRSPQGTTLPAALSHAAIQPGFLAFGSYLFLLRLAMGAVPWIFGLLQQQVYHMPATDVVLLANLLSVGALVGFWLGGRLVDRHGPKPVFMFAHAGYTVVAAWVLMRYALPLPTFAIFAIAAIAWGIFDAFSSIAVTTEVLALSPTSNRAFSISLLNAFGYAGVALSAWAGSAAIAAGLFRDGWSLFGMSMSGFDGLLIITCFLVTTFVVTLGLVPSVMKRHHDLP